MLMRTDPFRALDRLTQQVFGGQQGTWSSPAAMPMEAYREGERFVVALDLPGVDPSSIELSVEHDVLTIKVERRTAGGDGVETIVAERPYGVFTRRLFLGEALDTDRIEAHYDDGVLTLHVPVAEQATPRKIEITAGAGNQLTG